VLDPPADYPAYGEGYDAVFFTDPDGIKLEFVYLSLNIALMVNLVTVLWRGP
jgi:hypothetical protein